MSRQSVTSQQSERTRRSAAALSAVFGAGLLLAGCAAPSPQITAAYDHAGYKLPGSCHEADHLAADVPVEYVDSYELKLRTGKNAYGAAAYYLGSDGKPDRTTARIYLLNTLDRKSAAHASILCHERFHVLLGAWHS